MAKALEYASPAEANAARFLIRLALANGYAVSVNDGDEFVIKRSTDLHTILSAMCSTGEDFLLFRKKDGTKVGWMQLVWGNSAPELVADYSSNPDTDALWEDWHLYADKGC
jgi:hypothetical protein